MRRTVTAVAATFLLCLITVPAYPRKEKEDHREVMQDLVGIVVENNGPEEFEVPDAISDIIKSYYAEATVPQSVTDGVLSYLTGVYSEHGYHETGNWAPTTQQVRAKRGIYSPFKGELPDFQVSDFRMPAVGGLTSGFGFRKKFNRMHRGIDISLHTGDTVRCALPGVVTYKGFDPKGYGNYIIVSHAGNVETVYAHLKYDLVFPSQKLQAGDVVGIGGATGNATGPHLHFETRYKGSAYDPIPWFNLRGRFGKQK